MQQQPYENLRMHGRNLYKSDKIVRIVTLEGETVVARLDFVDDPIRPACGYFTHTDEQDRIWQASFFLNPASGNYEQDDVWNSHPHHRVAVENALWEDRISANTAEKMKSGLPEGVFKR